MRRVHVRTIGAPALAAVILTLSFSASFAGPPLICHSLDIGAAQSLPWGDKAFSSQSSYRLADLADETLEFLSPETPVLTRLETIRRATIYAKNDSPVASGLMARILSRAATMDRSDDAYAHALLDAGYLVACYSQQGIITDANGYELMRRAERLRPDDPAFDFACALATVHVSNRDRHLEHLRAAVDGAVPGSLLARNIEKMFGEIFQTLGQLGTRERSAKDANGG